jgi:hypothetical protein
MIQASKAAQDAVSALPNASPQSTPQPSSGAETSATSKAISSSGEPQPEPIMRRLWQRMAEIYGPRWTSAYGEDAGVGAGETWAKGLIFLTPAQIAIGLESAIASTDDWPPTLPAFRALCLGIPPIASVRAELADRDARRSPFTMLVWSRLDSYRYRMADADRADRLLREAYESAREHVMRGGVLPEARDELPAPEPETRTPASEETARRNVEAIVERLRIHEPDPTIAETP